MATDDRIKSAARNLLFEQGRITLSQLTTAEVYLMLYNAPADSEQDILKELDKRSDLTAGDLLHFMTSYVGRREGVKEATLKLVVKIYINHGLPFEELMKMLHTLSEGVQKVAFDKYEAMAAIPSPKEIMEIKDPTSSLSYNSPEPLREAERKRIGHFLEQRQALLISRLRGMGIEALLAFEHKEEQGEEWKKLFEEHWVNEARWKTLGAKLTTATAQQLYLIQSHDHGWGGNDVVREARKLLCVPERLAELATEQVLDLLGHGYHKEAVVAELALPSRERDLRHLAEI